MLTGQHSSFLWSHCALSASRRRLDVLVEAEEVVAALGSFPLHQLLRVHQELRSCRLRRLSQIQAVDLPHLIYEPAGEVVVSTGELAESSLWVFPFQGDA